MSEQPLPNPSRPPANFPAPAAPAPAPAPDPIVVEAAAVPTAPPPANPLTPEEQMAAFAQDLKENDWGHQPC